MVSVLQSRKFWALIVVVVLLFVGAVFPDFPLIEDHLTEVVALVAAYIVGVAIDPGKKPDFSQAGSKIVAVLKSRKFIATVAGLVVLVVRSLKPDFPIDDAQLTALILTLAAYVFGTGAEDYLKGTTLAG